YVPRLASVLRLYSPAASDRLPLSTSPSRVHAGPLHDALPISHITRATLDAAEEATLEGDKSRDVRSWEEANRRFHRLILDPCNMPRLLATIEDLHAASARFLFATWRSEWETRTDHDHRAILTALRQN